MRLRKRLKKATKQLWWRALIAAMIALLLVGSLLIVHQNSADASPTLPEPALKDLATARDIQLGNFAILSRLGEKPYTDILTSQFNVALLDNTPNWHFTNYDLRPGPNSYDFSQLDQAYAYAEANHMAVQAHHLVWGEQKWLPDWLKNGHYSRQQLLQIMHDHIMTVASRYKGRTQEWTVVNEAFSRAQHVFGLDDWWADNTGGQAYIDDAFRWAHEADPQAKLIINDFNNETENNISDAMYNYIKGAKARGVPIDGIGMQMHIDGTHPPKKDDVSDNMERFAALGVQVYVTEFDVNMHDLQANPKSRNNVEANIYYEMMRACIESRVCHSFSILGITDKETWYNYIGLTDAAPLMFDKHYKPKPAFYAFRQALLDP